MFYIGDASPSPAGPVELDVRREPPSVGLPRALQTLRFTQRQIQFVFRAQRELGDVFKVLVVEMRSHHDRPSEYPLVVHRQAEFLADRRVAVAPNSGPQLGIDGQRAHHLRQRKLLLPPFHGDRATRR